MLRAIQTCVSRMKTNVINKTEKLFSVAVTKQIQNKWTTQIKRRRRIRTRTRRKKHQKFVYSFYFSTQFKFNLVIK